MLTKDSFYEWADKNGIWDEVDILVTKLDGEPFAIVFESSTYGALLYYMMVELCPEAIEMYEKAGLVGGQRVSKTGKKHGWLKDYRLDSNGLSPQHPDSAPPYTTPQVVLEAFKKAGFNSLGLEDILSVTDWGYADEFSICDCCGDAVRIAPDSYTWLPEYWNNNGRIICKDCFNLYGMLDEYIEQIVNDPKKCIYFTLVTEEELSKLGFEKYNVGSYKNGMYKGMNDNPKDVYEKLKNSYKEVIFTIDHVNQFHTEFSAWVRNTDDGIGEM